MGMTSSHVHPWDGLAVRMNIRSDDATLYVHTNGSHSVARFDKDDVRVISTRDGAAPADETAPADHRFHFTGAQGVKLEAHGLQNDKPVGYMKDLNAFAYGIAYIDGKKSILQQGDLWKYAVCDKTTGRPSFYGMLVAEAYRAGSNYEPVSQLECTE